MNRPLPPDAHLIPQSATKVFEGILFDTYQWQQQQFDGTFRTFEMVKRPDTVSVIAVINDQIVLTKQLQPGWKEPKYSLPGGRVDKVEDPLTAAKRELVEEVGLMFAQWRLIKVEQPEEKIEWFIYHYLATDLIQKMPTHHDAGEQIEAASVSWQELTEYAQRSHRVSTVKQFSSLEALLQAPTANII